jgi:hypothetical protein
MGRWRRSLHTTVMTASVLITANHPKHLPHAAANGSQLREVVAISQQ